MQTLYVVLILFSLILLVSVIIFIIPKKYSCSRNGCTQSLFGQFNTKAECDAICDLSSYSCVGGSCVSVPDNSGGYNDLNTCLSACKPIQTYYPTLYYPQTLIYPTYYRGRGGHHRRR